VVLVNASNIAVATVPTKAHKNASGNWYRGRRPSIRRQESNMKMGYQDACSGDTKQDQSSCIPHQPARCDGCPQKKLKREGEFALDGKLKNSSERAEEQNGCEEDSGNCCRT
jgi:hypothetical protein